MERCIFKELICKKQFFCSAPSLRRGRGCSADTHHLGKLGGRAAYKFPNLCMCYFHISSGDIHESHHPSAFSCRALAQHRAVDKAGLERGCQGKTWSSRRLLLVDLGVWGEQGALGKAQQMAGPGHGDRESPDLQLV